MNEKKSGAKDVIYIDVDDEITAIIDKVRGSASKIVALVLPKRAAVLQSIVNMKLLKRSADSSKKHVVLITSEAGLLPLAGNVGVHVAKTLQSKPEIPDAPDKADDTPVQADEHDDDTAVEDVSDEELDTAKSVGELAGAAVVGEEVDTIELDDADEDGNDPKDDDSKATKPSKGKNKKLKVPNFNRFRLLLALAILALIGLSAFGYAAVAVMPKASISIKTDSTAVDSTSVAYLKTGDGVTVDLPNGVIPAVGEQMQKTVTQQVPATGSKNNGEKATGSIEMTAKDCVSPISSPKDVPAGSGVSTGGNTYITAKKASFNPDSIDSGCVIFKTNDIGIVAQTGGTKFNTAASASFTVAGRTDVTGTGSASGGTDDIIKIVSAGDIDSAKQKITAQDSAAVQQELATALTAKGLYPIEASFSSTAPDTKLSANAGTEAETVTVTQVVNYSLLGVIKADLEKLIADSVADDIDPKKQSILEYGLEAATYTIKEAKPDGTIFDVTTTVVAGPDLDVNDIRKQVAGKKAGEAQEIIKSNPGVTDVIVEYSPFWVSSIPKKTDKITITIEKPEVPVKADADTTTDADTTP